MRYVQAIVEHGTFTRAAEHLFVTQSALSQSIAALERELGLRLFARSTRRVELTPSGEAFLPAARQALAAAERAAAEAAAASGEVSGSLAIGMIPTVTSIDLPRALRRFAERHPRVRISLRPGASDEFARLIRTGALDVAILGLRADVSPEGVATRVLAHDRLAAVLPLGHPLADRAELSPADLAHERFVDFPAGSPGRSQGDGVFAAAGIAREAALETADITLMLALIRAGMGVGILPEGYARSAPGCATVPLRTELRRVEYLAWSSFNPSPATQAFVAAVAESAPGAIGSAAATADAHAVDGEDAR